MSLRPSAGRCQAGYRAFFKTDILEELIGADVQTIVPTENQKMWKGLAHRYLHKNIDMFQVALTDRANSDSTAVLSDCDGKNLGQLESKVQPLLRRRWIEVHRASVFWGARLICEPPPPRRGCSVAEVTWG